MHSDGGCGSACISFTWTLRQCHSTAPFSWKFLAISYIHNKIHMSMYKQDFLICVEMGVAVVDR